MNIRKRLIYASLCIGTFVASLTSFVDAQEFETLLAPANPIASNDNRGNEENGRVLMKGPVHEAFAEQFSEQPTFGLLVPSKSPEMIDEIPPDIKPAGDQMLWIPGYWGWDEELRDFVWVTGIWRQSPPGRRWVPGYWNQVENGYQWVSGFWADARLEQIEYLPAPPPPVEAIASVPSPDENYFYIPGTWIYGDQRYQWRAGFWAASNPNWIWIPDCYVWTPIGHIYRSGYWDHPLANRGTLFCPMQFQAVYPGFRFQPRYVVGTGLNWLANLFVYPAYRHYYFGDYYASRFRQQSIYPWNAYSQLSNQFDPFYTYYAIHRQRDLTQVDQLFRQLENNPVMRPPRTLREQIDARQLAQGQSPLLLQATDIADLAGNSQEFRKKGWDVPIAYERVRNDQAAQAASNLDPLRLLQKNRSDVESQRSNSVKGDRAAVASSVQTPDVRLRLPQVNQQLSDVRHAQSTGPLQGQRKLESYQVLRPNFDQPGRPRVNVPNNNQPSTQPSNLTPRQGLPQPRVQNNLSLPAQRPSPQPPVQQPPNMRPQLDPSDRNANGRFQSPQNIQRTPPEIKNPPQQNRPEAPANRSKGNSPNRGEGNGRDKPKIGKK